MKGDKSTHWFKRKRYGWGWTPATREGWLVILAYALYILFIFKDIEESFNHWIIVQAFAATYALLAICYRTGEKPKWTWGAGDKRRR